MTLHELTNKICADKVARLIVLASRAGIGKSSVAIGMALDFADRGKKVNFITCTEKPSFLKQHMEFIHHGELTETQKENIKTSEPKAYTVAEIKEFCENLPDAVFIDSIQDMDLAGGSFADLQKALELLSVELGCPVIVLSKLQGKFSKLFSNKPTLSELAKSGIDEALCAEVMLVYRKAKYKLNANKDECTIIFKDHEEQFVWSDVTNCIM